MLQDRMSGPVLRIGGDLPITDVSALPDTGGGGSTIEISNIIGNNNIPAIMYFISIYKLQLRSPIRI